jgi:hypothetical protein
MRKLTFISFFIAALISLIFAYLATQSRQISGQDVVSAFANRCDVVIRDINRDELYKSSLTPVFLQPGGRIKLINRTLLGSNTEEYFGNNSASDMLIVPLARLDGDIVYYIITLR